MELRHLRYFLAVAQAQSFSRAAEQLHIAQPPLSRQIRQLEDELGAELFDRSARPLALTPAGLFLQSQAQLLLDRVQEVRAGTSRIARGERRWFGIGFVPSALYGGLPTVIRRFREARPNVEVGLLEMTTVQQIEALKAGRIDVGFGRLRLADDRISGEVVRAEAVVAALPTGHALAAHRKLSLVKLVGEPLLLYPAKPRPSYADQVLEMFRSRGLAPTVALEANEMQTALGLAAAGIGYALVPEPVTRQQREGLVYRPLSDPGLYTPLVMNCRADDESALLRGFREMVHTVKRERDAAGVPDGSAPPSPA